jgi:hypothetical protein
VGFHFVTLTITPYGGFINLSDAQGRLAQWRLRLLEFDYEVKYHPGALHHGADMTSRLRSEDSAIAEPTEAVATEVPCFALADERDPSLFHPHDFRTAHISDPRFYHLHAQYGAPRLSTSTRTA